LFLWNQEEKAIEIPPVKDNSKRNIIIIVIVVAVLICCLVVGIIVVAGGGAAYFLTSSSKVSTVPASEIIAPSATSLPEDTATPEEIVSPEETATSETVLPPSETPQEQSASNSLGLGVNRDDMEQFLGVGGAFTFGKPSIIQGLEVVMGTSSSQCIQTNCASVTLLGPVDDLLAVSVVAPTDPNDPGQTAMACALLMTVSARFAQDSSGIAMQILTGITQAQTAQTNLNKTVIDNGYEFTIIYNPQTHNAGLAVARPKP
jgi:hypothetical protein